jgi:KDO2-lipid IV(A) lauroyltransferase
MREITIKALLKGSSTLFNLLPEKIGLALGVFLSHIAYFIYKLTPYRDFITNNIITAYKGGYTRREAERLAKRHVTLLAKSIVEFLRLPQLNIKNIEKKVKIQGLGNLDRSLRCGRGVILVSPHFGNWELLSVTLSLMGYQMNVFYQKARSRALNNFFLDRRSSKGVRSIYRWDKLREVLQLLKRNEVLGIVADQHGEFENIFVEFFGHVVSVPGGPAGFAYKSGAPIIPVFMVRDLDDTHTLIIEDPIIPNPSKNKHREIEDMSRKFMKTFEEYIKRYPDHWLWSYNRWDKIKRTSIEELQNVSEKCLVFE